MRRIIQSALIAVGFCFAVAAPATAQAYPNRPIKIIVAFTPGGATDLIARLVAQHMSAQLGQTVVVENRPGAGGTIGTKAVASADADGYTLLLGSSGTLSIGPALYRNIDYDPIRSFMPVAYVASTALVVVVRPEVPAKTVAELVAYAKANPGKLNFGGGLGTPPHLVGALFKVMTGTDITYIPYKGGAPSVTDLLGGQIQIGFEITSAVLPHVQEGKLKAIAVTNPARSPELPDVPTMVESGFPGFTYVTWTGIVAPAGTPAAIVAKLNGAINAGLTSAEAKASLARLSFEAKVGSPEDFAAFIADDVPKWTAAVRLSGARGD